MTNKKPISLKYTMIRVDSDALISRGQIIEQEMTFDRNVSSRVYFRTESGDRVGYEIQSTPPRIGEKIKVAESTKVGEKELLFGLTKTDKLKSEIVLYEVVDVVWDFTTDSTSANKVYVTVSRLESINE